MSSSVFDTGVELLWRAVLGFGVEESVCATTLVVIRTASAKASGRFIFSPESSVGQMITTNGRTLGSSKRTCFVVIRFQRIVSWRGYKFVKT